jgi:hypothetical protein
MRNIVSTKRLILLAATAVGMMLTTSSGRVMAGQPQPDCGPTFEWNCVVPGCPECPEILFEGTVCEKNAFEKKTGRVCTLE